MNICKRHEAAERLGISVRLLDAKTLQGSIPHIRIGSRVLYDVNILDDWIKDQAAASLKAATAPATPSPARRRRRMVQPVASATATVRRRSSPVRPEDGAA